MGAHQLQGPVEVGRCRALFVFIVNDHYDIAFSEQVGNDVNIAVRAVSYSVGVDDIKNEGLARCGKLDRVWLGGLKQCLQLVLRLRGGEGLAIVVDGNVYGNTDITIVCHRFRFANLIRKECIADGREVVRLAFHRAALLMYGILRDNRTCARCQCSEKHQGSKQYT